MVRLYSSEEIYRPIWERESAFLEVCRGCSWRRCTFCDFAKDDFYVFSISEVHEKIKKLAEISRDKSRVFFLGENPLCVSTEQLLAIMELVQIYMPWVREISMYARCDDILNKTERELLLLRKANLIHLHVGMESGNDEVLEFAKKGVCAEQFVLAAKKMRRADISFSYTVITGIGGKKWTDVHVKDTARLLNETQPASIWINGLRELASETMKHLILEKKFEPLTLFEKFVETLKILENLELQDCQFADTTVLGKYTLLGRLPKGKQAMLEQGRKILEEYKK